MSEVKKVETPMIDNMQSQMVASLVESMLPKIQPMIQPMVGKLSEFLGDDEKCLIVFKRGKDKPTSVVVLDRNKGFKFYGGEKKGFEIDSDGDSLPALLHNHTVEEFVGMLLSGQFGEMK